MKVLEKRMFASESLFRQIMEERNVLMKGVNHPFLIVKLNFNLETILLFPDPRKIIFNP